MTDDTRLHQPFLTVDEAKAELGITGPLRPTAVDCAACGQRRRAAAGDHICLWCRVGEHRGSVAHPCGAPGTTRADIPAYCTGCLAVSDPRPLGHVPAGWARDDKQGVYRCPDCR